MYRDISDYWVENIEDCVEMLKRFESRGDHVYYKFNGVLLYSDTVTLESAYKEITGHSKEELIEIKKQSIEESKRRREEYMKQIPSLTQEWIEKGHKIIDQKYWSLWDECVPIRLDDLYHGMELGCALQIIEPLNNGCEISEAIKIMEDQNHSGMSWGLVRSMVYYFCDRGPEFAEKAV